MKLKPVQRCIYCGAGDVPLSDEHVVPFSLGGTWILPKASCSDCAGITSRAERDISRGTYLALRTKAGFPTYRPRKRPRSFDVIAMMPDGSRRKISVAANKYPTLYPILHLPPPGILTNAALQDTNPEIRIDLAGNQDELTALSAGIPNAHGLEFPIQISWDSLCRSIAKIAHSYTVGTCGFVGYTQLLPPLILGDYPYLSHLVGGAVTVKESRVSKSSDGLALSIDPEGHIVVNVDILGGRLPTYSAVSGRVTNWNQFMTSVSHASREGKPEYQHSLKTRFGFNHDWAIEIVRSVRGVVERDFPQLIAHWPLINGFAFDAYALGSSHLLIVLRNSDDTVPSGPDGQLKISAIGYPSLPPIGDDLPLWREWLAINLNVTSDEWPMIVPVHDSGRSSANADYELFTEGERDFWDAQWQYLINCQLAYASTRYIQFQAIPC